jgi:hypothetical protein
LHSVIEGAYGSYGNDLELKVSSALNGYGNIVLTPLSGAETKINSAILATGNITTTGYINNNPTLDNTAKLFNTVYQNTGTSKMIYVSFIINGNAVQYTNYFTAYIGATNSPSNVVGTFTNSAIGQFVSISFLVEHNWYYTIQSTGSISIYTWTEQII